MSKNAERSRSHSGRHAVAASVAPSDARALLITRDALAEIEARARGGGWHAVARIVRAALKASLKASRESHVPASPEPRR